MSITVAGSSFIAAGGGQVGGEVGGSEVVGGLHHHRRLANPAGLFRRTPVSTQTPCSAGRTVPRARVRRNRRTDPEGSSRARVERPLLFASLRDHTARVPSSARCACPILAARLTSRWRELRLRLDREIRGLRPRKKSRRRSLAPTFNAVSP